MYTGEGIVIHAGIMSHYHIMELMLNDIRITEVGGKQ
jgi:hypothetical protein